MSLIDILLAVFLLECGYALWWGLSRRDRVFQYPFLAGTAWSFYILPQSLGIINNPELLPHIVRQSHGIEKTLLMTILCAGLGIAGYQMHPLKALGRSPPCSYSVERIGHGGILLSVLGMLGFAGLTALSGGGILSYFSSHGNYALEWRGLPVAYAFFMKLVFPGLLLLLVSALLTRSFWHWLLVGAASLLPVAIIVLLARREPTFFLLSIVGLALHFCRRWTPPRLAVIACTLAGGVWVMVAPQFRDYMPIGSERSGLREVDVVESVQSVFAGERDRGGYTLGVTMIAAYDDAQVFYYGRNLYNAVVAMFVPKLLVGEDFKSRLMFDLPDRLDVAADLTGEMFNPNSSITGVADAFREFSYFGSLLFFVIGATYRWLWERALAWNNLAGQLYYAVLAVLALKTVSSEVFYFLPGLIWAWMFLGPLFWYARQRECVSGRPSNGWFRAGLGGGGPGESVLACSQRPQRGPGVVIVPGPRGRDPRS